MGARFVDYAIADSIVAPAGSEVYFTERVARMPHCFFPAIPYETPAESRSFCRADFHLPDNAIVFVCFNGAFKISPPAWDAWMIILKNVPESVLWLSVRDPTVQANLQNEARVRGVDTARLVFAEHLKNKADHLARVSLGDLFLDTFDYGAHMTACDALWAGLPVLALPRDSFASRVSASMLTALGAPELIASSVDDYIERAVALATDANARESLRKKIAQQRAVSPLFDVQRFVRDLENLWQSIASDARNEPDAARLS
jgi:predicted O-linked N-acetylglucosamine transferase (SPINDLY family)